MAGKKKTFRPKPRLPKGFRDVPGDEIRGINAMLEIIGQVYETYGFDPVETPFMEYTESLGKFLPDEDRPNEGVFSLRDEDDQWLSLRYDLTAPLARHVAESYDRLAKPYRTYRSGWVFRNEKPGPGRYRQFMQFDADTVGTASPAADAEVCMMAADILEKLGISRAGYVIKLNNRKILDGVLEAIGMSGEGHAATRLGVLRAIDKLDRLGPEGVRLLLADGRKDESGDFTKGAGLSPQHIAMVMGFVEARGDDRNGVLDSLARLVGDSTTGAEGIAELKAMCACFDAAGYGPDRIAIDASVVRGLAYYTGAVFEAELLFSGPADGGKPVRFGSVGGGGRYDGLVARFRGEAVPATGFSIGVSRLYAALQHLNRAPGEKLPAPVVVLVMDKERTGEYQALAGQLRAAGIRAEMYMGTSGMKAQMKYADRRGAPAVIIQGSQEREAGQVQIKDLAAGARASKDITERDEWRSARPAQFSVATADMVSAVAQVLAGARD